MIFICSLRVFIIPYNSLVTGRKEMRELVVHRKGRSVLELQWSTFAQDLREGLHF